MGLRYPLTESADTVVYVDQQKMPRLDSTDAHADLDVRCPQIAKGPFSCIAHHVQLYCSILDTLFVPWPEGDYALPMSIYGCSYGDTTNWKYGYMNISFEWPTHIYTKKAGRHWKSQPSFLLGPYGSHSLQINFCTRVHGVVSSTGNTKQRWPLGQYSIYGTEAGCPGG